MFKTKNKILLSPQGKKKTNFFKGNMVKKMKVVMSAVFKKKM